MEQLTCFGIIWFVADRCTGQFSEKLYPQLIIGWSGTMYFDIFGYWMKWHSVFWHFLVIVVFLLQQDRTELFNFVHGHQSWSDYLRNMAADGTWGDPIILLAVANCFETCIHVISSLSHDLTIHPEHKVRSSSQLVLGHLHEHHYVSLRPKRGRGT